MRADAAKVYSIAPGRPFLEALADGLLARVGADPMALSDFTLLLPTRRACRALAEAFLRRTAGRPLLLPAGRCCCRAWSRSATSTSTRSP